MADTIHVEEKKGVAVVYLNRPEAYNAFDLEYGADGLPRPLSIWPSTGILPAWSSRGKARRFAPAAI
jgi:hypothetical protein